MTILRPQSAYGEAPPPQTPYSVVTNIPKWETCHRFREGDMSVVKGLKHIYPRRGPTHYVTELGKAIAGKLGIEGKECFLYLNPEMWPYTDRHVSDPHRGDSQFDPSLLERRCVDVAGHRLYAVFFPPEKTPGMILSWGNPGVGLSIRGAEQLLQGIGTMKEVEFKEGEVPEPTWTPESPGHEALKERVSTLVNRAPHSATTAVTTSPSDVFVYPTGMSAIWHSSRHTLEYRPGSIVVLGVVFHNTYHHFLDEAPHGFKHVPKVDAAGLADFEKYLDDQAALNQTVSYVLVEVPGNPTCDTVDTRRLKRLSEKHGFVLVADDTLSGFGNIDVLPWCDILMTSLTKSFSGYANVMGGSIVLNPKGQHYTQLKSLVAEKHRNEYFAIDAEVLLANSQDFFSRTVVLNHNANAAATFLQSKIDSDPDCVLTKVRYPSLMPSKHLYDDLMRGPTEEIPHPGYGCLMNLEFEDLDAAIAFHDNCGFYASPHLGAHVTIQFAYSMVVFGKKPDERAYFSDVGSKEESVRVSVGLEKTNDILETLEFALEKAKALKKLGYKEQ